MGAFLICELTCIVVVCISAVAQSQGQVASATGPSSLVGDSPETTLPLAHDVSPVLRRRDIEHAMRKVADWQLARTPNLGSDWTFAVLDVGILAAADTLKAPAYRDAVFRMAQQREWRLGTRTTHADDQAVGQAYLRIFEQRKTLEMIQPARKQFDDLKQQPDDPSAPVWWWCDALFMAPPVWSGLSRVTGDRSYLDYMDREWWITSTKLYDHQEHLFFRDANYLDRKEANGKKLFWLRGNGWVLAGLARVLENMPADYPARDKYLTQYAEMAASLAALQQPDGLWRTGLLDEPAYPLPETSGSALVVYALAWGINHHCLSRAKYAPVVEKAWKGLISHIYEDGRLGSIQPIGEKPDAFRPTSSYVYGVGAFLLAGSELTRYATR